MDALRGCASLARAGSVQGDSSVREVEGRSGSSDPHDEDGDQDRDDGSRSDIVFVDFVDDPVAVIYEYEQVQAPTDDAGVVEGWSLVRVSLVGGVVWWGGAE